MATISGGCVASIATALLAHPAAWAQTTDAIAEALFLQGQERMAAQDIPAACDLFARSLKVDRRSTRLLVSTRPGRVRIDPIVPPGLAGFTLAAAAPIVQSHLHPSKMTS